MRFSCLFFYFLLSFARKGKITIYEHEPQRRCRFCEECMALGYTYVERSYVKARIHHSYIMHDAYERGACQIPYALERFRPTVNCLLGLWVQQTPKYSIFILHLCINISDQNSRGAEHITSLNLFGKINVRRRFQWQPEGAPYSWRMKLIQNQTYRAHDYSKRPAQTWADEETACWATRLPPKRKCRFDSWLILVSLHACFTHIWYSIF